MMHQDFFAYVGCVYMGVYLSGSDAFVSEHALYGTQVGSSFQQMCGKGMAKGVWTDAFLYSSPFGMLFDNIKHHVAC